MAQLPSAAPRYALLDCEDSEKWKGHEQLAEDLLHKGAHWDVYRCHQHEFPALESLSKYTGLLVTGSHYSAYEDHAWIKELQSWLTRAVEQGSTRILGICFGSQVLAAALGGEVGKNPSGRFVLQVESLKVSEELQQCDAFQRAVRQQLGEGQQPPAELRIIESHGDQVLRLPGSARTLATSPTAFFEMWGVGHNVLAIQGHAEFSRDIVMEKIHPTMAGSGRLSAEEAEQSKRSIQEDAVDSPLIVQFLREFMLLGLHPASTPLPSPRSARSHDSTDSSRQQASVDALAHKLEQTLQVAVGQMLQRGPAEQQLLQQLNAVTLQRLKQTAPPIAAAKRQLETVNAQQEALLPALQAVDILEQQVSSLEQRLTALEDAAKRFEAS